MQPFPDVFNFDDPFSRLKHQIYSNQPNNLRRITQQSFNTSPADILTEQSYLPFLSDEPRSADSASPYLSDHKPRLFDTVIRNNEDLIPIFHSGTGTNQLPANRDGDITQTFNDPYQAFPARSWFPHDNRPKTDMLIEAPFKGPFQAALQTFSQKVIPSQGDYVQKSNNNQETDLRGLKICSAASSLELERTTKDPVTSNKIKVASPPVSNKVVSEVSTVVPKIQPRKIRSREEEAKIWEEMRREENKLVAGKNCFGHLKERIAKNLINFINERKRFNEKYKGKLSSTSRFSSTKMKKFFEIHGIDEQDVVEYIEIYEDPKEILLKSYHMKKKGVNFSYLTDEQFNALYKYSVQKITNYALGKTAREQPPRKTKGKKSNK